MAGDVLPKVIFSRLYACMVQVEETPKGGAMLKPEQEQLANEFYRAAVAPGEVDAKSKVLIATAGAMTVGCYP